MQSYISYGENEGLEEEGEEGEGIASTADC
jgi:hypothetical protein